MSPAVEYGVDELCEHFRKTGIAADVLPDGSEELSKHDFKTPGGVSMVVATVSSPAFDAGYIRIGGEIIKLLAVRVEKIGKWGHRTGTDYIVDRDPDTSQQKIDTVLGVSVHRDGLHFSEAMEWKGPMAQQLSTDPATTSARLTELSRSCGMPLRIAIGADKKHRCVRISQYLNLGGFAKTMMYIQGGYPS